MTAGAVRLAVVLVPDTGAATARLLPGRPLQLRQIEVAVAAGDDDRLRPHLRRRPGASGEGREQDRRNRERSDRRGRRDGQHDREHDPPAHGTILRQAPSYLIRLSSRNIGRYIEMMITPTIAPTRIIISGSMIEVSVAIAESTSSS